MKSLEDLKSVEDFETALAHMTAALPTITDLDAYQSSLTTITYLTTQLYRLSEEFRDAQPTVH